MKLQLNNYFSKSFVKYVHKKFNKTWIEIKVCKCVCACWDSIIKYLPTLNDYIFPIDVKIVNSNSFWDSSSFGFISFYPSLSILLLIK